MQDSPRRRFTIVAGALALVTALVAGLLLLTGASSGEARALALSFERGQIQRYRVELSVDAEASLPGGLSIPLSGTIAQTLSWRVRSVDADGVATVEVSAGDFKGSLEGLPVPDLTRFEATMRIDPEGRIQVEREAGPDATRAGRAFDVVPATGRITPILPPGPVSPGDTWSDSFEHKLPSGGGTLEVSGTGEYVRDDEIDGTRVAVVRTTISVPMDFSIDLGELIGASGAGKLVPGKRFDALQGVFADMELTYRGSAGGTTTSWVGLEDQRILRSESVYDVDVTGGTGPAGAAATTSTIRGDLTMSVEAL